MNMKEFSHRYNIALSKVKKIHKDGYLVHVTADDDLPERMTRYLACKRRLSVEMLISLLRDQTKFAQLGNMRPRAEKQVRDLNPATINATAMPVEKWGDIIGAAINDPDCLNSLADWLLQAIPIGGCDYHYIAVRMLWHVPADRVSQVYSRIPRALINVRAMPRLAGRSEVKAGQTKFLHVEEKIFDL